MKRVQLFEQFIESDYLTESVKFGKKAIKAKLQDKLELAKKAIEKWGDMYEPSLKKVEAALKSGKIDVNNIFHVQGGEPQSSYDIFKGNNAMQLASEIAKVLKKYKKDEVEQSSIPAMAGWSGNMRSTVGGKIEGHANFSNGSSNYLIAVTVGGGVDRSVREKIFQEVYELLFIFDEYNGSDGGVSISMDSGTNYHTLGLKNSSYSFNNAVASKIKSTINESFIKEDINEAKVDKKYFDKVVKVLSKSKYPFTIMLVSKWNEIDIVIGYDAPDHISDDIDQKLSKAKLSWGGNSGITISGDSSNYSRREYDDIARINGGHKDY